MKLRIRIIQMFLDLLEALFFYNKLKNFYISILGGKKNITVLDVGSNKGQSIEFFKGVDKNARIYGFEPNSELFNKLMKKYEKDSNVSVANAGVSSKEGTLTLHENVMNETSTFEKLNHDSDYLKRKAKVLGVPVEKLTKKSYDVEVMTLSSFIKSKEDIFIDIIKIDVEGHEYDCIKGLFSDPDFKVPVRIIQLEKHMSDMVLNSKSDKIDGLMQANGFKEVHRIKHSFGGFFELFYENQNL